MFQYPVQEGVIDGMTLRLLLRTMRAPHLAINQIQYLNGDQLHIAQLFKKNENLLVVSENTYDCMVTDEI